MKKINYVVNLAGAVVAFYIYELLQECYFYPAAIGKRLQLNPGLEVSLIVILTVFVLSLIFWLYKKQLEAGRNEWGFNEAPHWQKDKFFLACAGIILIWFLGAFMLQLVTLTGSTISANQEDLDQIQQQSGILFKITVCLIAPFCEETIFRGMFFNTFFTKATRKNKYWGIAISGLVFAIMHDPQFTKFILVYWVLGCVLAWVYLGTKDLRYSMITHMVYNFLGLL